MKARRTLLCDLAQRADTGKTNLLGVFDRFLLGAIPCNLPSFYLYTQILEDSPGELKPGEANISIDLISPSKKLVVNVLGPVSLPEDEEILAALKEGKPVRLTVVVQFQQVPVEEYGTYRVVLKVGKEKLDEIDVEVEVFGKK